jgi:hypothetical protein
MNKTTMEERVETLERRLNRYRLLTSLVGVAAVGLLGVAATSTKDVQDAVRTRRLTVVSDQGADVADLRAGPRGGILLINNLQGNCLVGAGVQEKGAEIFIADESNARRVHLQVVDSNGQLVIQDKKGETRTITAGAAPKPEK